MCERATRHVCIGASRAGPPAWQTYVHARVQLRVHVRAKRGSSFRMHQQRCDGVQVPSTLCHPSNARSLPPPGPFFEGVDHLDFYNLELSDTDITDFSCHS